MQTMPPFLMGPSVSVSYERALQAFLRSRGLGNGAKDLATDQRVGSRVEGISFGSTLVRGGRELGDAALGLSFGTRVGGAGFGLLGVAAATAPTLRDSVRHLQRFESLTSTLGHMGVRRRGRLVSLLWEPDRPDLPQEIAEAILTGWVSFGRYLLGERAEVAQVRFRHSPAATAAVYEDKLDCPVRFDAGENSVTVHADLMDAKPRLSEPTINGALDAWLDRCTLGVSACRTRPFARRVAQVLDTGIDLAQADEPTIAHALGMSRRTLQRKLDAEGTAFRHLLDAARAQQAIVGVLRGDTPLAQLCADVGFDEQSSLCRAFRRWTGHSPSSLKHRLQGMFDDLRPGQ
jgi:AraC-like DNA-binding protein